MKRQLKRLLMKWPGLYNFVANLYFNLDRHVILERVLGTRARERQWATRHSTWKGDDWKNERFPAEKNDWILGYWESRNHPHRRFLLDAIEAFAPISSVLEIGCNCGPNLYVIAQKFPGIEIHGIDINPAAIQNGKEFLASEGVPNVRLSVARADELGQFQDRSFDVVLCDAVLIYIGRDKIRGIVGEMIRVARKGLVLVERHSFESGKRDTHGLGFRRYGLWHRDYIALFKQFVPEEQIHVTKISGDMWPDDSGWQETGAIIEVVLPFEGAIVPSRGCQKIK